MSPARGNKYMTASPATRVLGVVAVAAALLMALLGLKIRQSNSGRG